MLLQSLQYKLDIRTAKAQLDISKQGTEGALRGCPGDGCKQLTGCHGQFQGGSNFQEQTQMAPHNARLCKAPSTAHTPGCRDSTCNLSLMPAPFASSLSGWQHFQVCFLVGMHVGCAVLSRAGYLQTPTERPVQDTGDEDEANRHPRPSCRVNDK